MGLFSKKEACPACGGEVKGLFLVKFGDKKTLCKTCSKQVSMSKSLLKTAAPEFIKEHLEYRRQNAEKYAAHHWTTEITSIPGLKFGLDEAGEAIYLVHDSLHDDENPVILSFDQLTGYELFRQKSKLDDIEETGDIPLESNFSTLAGLVQLAKNDNSANIDTFHLKLTTTEPYWKEMDLKIDFTDDQLYGIGGFAKDMKTVCQIIKTIVRKESLSCIH